MLGLRVCYLGLRVKGWDMGFSVWGLGLGSDTEIFDR